MVQDEQTGRPMWIDLAIALALSAVVLVLAARGFAAWATAS